jgi:hypothetical protein
MAKPQLPPDFREFLKLFLKHEVRFLVIGGMAVIYHGHPRLTLDIDLWVERSRENGERILSALRDFGFSDSGLAASDFEKERQIIRMGIKPTMIEIFTSIPGVEFGPCSEKQVMVDLRGLEVPFISLADLKVNKKASGRLKDLQDLEELP